MAITSLSYDSRRAQVAFTSSAAGGALLFGKTWGTARERIPMPGRGSGPGGAGMALDGVSGRAWVDAPCHRPRGAF